MGREIKRVVAGFDWPVDELWPGFINPHNPRQCATCEGTGESPTARRFSDEWYGRTLFNPSSTGSNPFGMNHPAIRVLARRNVLFDHATGKLRRERCGDADAIYREANRLASQCFDNHWSHHLSEADVKALVDANRLMDLTHTWSREGGWRRRAENRMPIAAEVNEWSLTGMGHDSINQWVCVKARCEREGVSSKCGVCTGSGIDPADAATVSASEAWEETPPPKGDWWQVWETVSEGSPVTPAFATAEELVEHLVGNGDAWDQKRGDGGWDRAAAESFVKAGWAPSLILSDGVATAARGVLA